MDGVQPPYVEPWNKHSYTIYSILLDNFESRQRTKSYLAEEGVETRINFPPIHKQPAFIGKFGNMGRYPVAEQAGRCILGLPIYPGLTEEQQDFVIDTIRCAVRQ